MTELNLRGCKIGDKGNLAVASALQVNTSIQRIDVGATDLEISGIIAYCTVLRQNTTLKAVNLDRPLLKSKQVRGTALSLLLPPTVYHAPPTTCEASSHCAVAAVELVQEETTVHLAQMLSINSSLEEIHLQRVSYGFARESMLPPTPNAIPISRSGPFA